MSCPSKLTRSRGTARNRSRSESGLSSFFPWLRPNQPPTTPGFDKSSVFFWYPLDMRCATNAGLRRALGAYAVQEATLAPHQISRKKNGDHQGKIKMCSRFRGHFLPVSKGRERAGSTGSYRRGGGWWRMAIRGPRGGHVRCNFPVAWAGR